MSISLFYNNGHVDIIYFEIVLKKNSMKLHIKSSTSINEIKETFHNSYPYLKIEFFKKPHIEGEPTALIDMIKDNIAVGEINSHVKESLVSFNPDDSVAKVEQGFRDMFGLSVQVFRRQKQVWIETTRTDHLTLAEQNNMGKEASSPALKDEQEDRYLNDGEYQ